MIILKLLLFFCLYVVDAQLNVSISRSGPEKLRLPVDQADILFADFVNTYKKHYVNKNEYNYRREIFRKNLKDINRRNAKSDSDVYGITQFSDLTSDEFIREHTGLRTDLLLNETAEPEPLLMQIRNVPDHWDWRTKGAVTPVRNQGLCGSCWSFSAVAIVEAQLARKYKRLVMLSDQQLLDCFKEGGGCDSGSLPHLALIDAARMGGLMAAFDYPYTGRKEYCKYNPEKIYVRVKGGHRRMLQDEEHLKYMIYIYGPVATGLHVAKAFSEYKGGIATPETLGCHPSKMVNHAITVVGYGSENGVPYWILKNSFSRHWGEQGYMRLKRGNNPCNILKYVASADIY